MLVLVVAVLTVSYGSSLKAYLQQRSQIAELKEQIAVREQSIGALEREKRRWEDPAFVQAQARERFGYLMPGETSYVVLDENGQPLESEARLHDPDEVVKVEPTAWWTTRLGVRGAGRRAAGREGRRRQAAGLRDRRHART